MRGSIANSSFHPANFLAVSPGFRFTRLIPFTMSPERQFQMRRAKLLVLQHARLVERLAAQHFVPELFIQSFGLGRLVLKRLQIHHPRQRRRPAAGLIPLVAMQRDGIRLQPAGKKIGRARHPARRDDDRPFLCPSPIGWERVAEGRVRVSVWERAGRRWRVKHFSPKRELSQLAAVAPDMNALVFPGALDRPRAAD